VSFERLDHTRIREVEELKKELAKNKIVRRGNATLLKKAFDREDVEVFDCYSPKYDDLVELQTISRGTGMVDMSKT
jgi:hypothetical protein